MLRAHQLKREAELAAARLQASEAARLAVQADLAHERTARQVFAGEVATNESAVAAAAAAGSYCDLVDQFLRREEWLRDCAESDKKHVSTKRWMCVLGT